MNYRIDLDEYRLDVEVTHCVIVKPLPATRDSRDDYHGYREMEFEAVGGVRVDEDGAITELDRAACAEVAHEHGDLIEALIWKLIEAAASHREAA